MSVSPDWLCGISGKGGMRAEPIVGVTIRHIQNFALARRGMLAQYCPPVQPDCAEQQSLAL